MLLQHILYQMVKHQQVIKGSNGRLLLVLRARFVEDFGLKGGEKYCMRNGTGRTLIIDFDCKDEEVDE